MDTVYSVVNKDQCVSCGICAGLCAKNAIAMVKNSGNGMVYPVIDKAKCVHCGMCVKVCPGKAGVEFSLQQKKDRMLLQQTAARCYYTGHITDDVLIEETASGGITSELIRTLLDENRYDAAFILNTFNYSAPISTKKIQKPLPDPFEGRSRYVPVLHDEAVKYILHNRDKRVIVVGTSCAISGIRKTIDLYKLDPDQYLLLGLFCEKTMTYQVWDYFFPKMDREGILYFKHKALKGWPGQMRLVRKDGEVVDLPKRKRLEAKDFFCSERCLYCIDKLNQNADISLGDNYTGKNTHARGTSSVIIRTDQGEAAFDAIKDKCVLFESSAEEVVKSQEIKKKKENIVFAKFRYENSPTYTLKNLKLFAKYVYKLLKIKAGRVYQKCSLPMRTIICFERVFKRY